MYQQLLALEEEIFKVIANQKRLEIIQLLNHKELHVSEMVEMLGIRQANLSQHLAILRQSNLVKVRKDGQKVYYHLADKGIAKAVDAIYRFLENQQRIDASVKFPTEPAQIYPIAKDPVCGMRISVHEAYDKAQHDGKVYYFCASGCRQRFVSHPTAFISKRKEKVYEK